MVLYECKSCNHSTELKSNVSIEVMDKLHLINTDLKDFSKGTRKKIRDVIGTGGKVIREIVDTTGARVSVEDDGTIKIASTDKKSIEAAKEWIHSLTAEPEAGVIYKGKVVKVVDFGAFVNFFGKKDGLVHVSQILPERVNHPSDHLKEGQEVYVKLMGFDDRGKVRLAMKYVDQETGLEIPREPREDNKDKDKDEELPETESTAISLNRSEKAPLFVIFLFLKVPFLNASGPLLNL